MRFLICLGAVSAVLLSMSGCSTTPDTIVQGPLTARPLPPAVNHANNGAIFQTSTYRPMFEDRRARFVGDTLIMTINEKTTAAKSADNTGSKTGSVNGAITSLFSVPASTLGKLGASGSTSNKFEDKGNTSSSNSFSGTIGVTVIDVLPNGNLVVSGEKQVAFDTGTEFIRFSGVVNPDFITTGNNISSTQVADARVEYRTNSHVDGAQIMSMLTRFFLSVMPM